MENIFSGKRKLAFLFIFLFLIAGVFAEVNTNQVDDVFQINSIVDYSKPCRNDGAYCSSSADCNYTIKTPSNSESVAVATYNAANGEANTSINFDELGIWSIEMTCCDGGECASKTLYAEVSGSGFNDTFGFFIIILVLSLGVIVLGLWKQDAIITLLGTFGLYFLGIYILLNGISGIRDPVTTWASGLITLGIAFYISTRSAYEIIT